MPDFDSPWKEALERYFPSSWPSSSPPRTPTSTGSGAMSFSTKSCSRSPAMPSLAGGSWTSSLGFGGTMVKRNLVLIHIEVQGQSEAEFAERMFVYNYRLYDRYRRPVVSLAVLGDEGAQLLDQVRLHFGIAHLIQAVQEQ